MISIEKLELLDKKVKEAVGLIQSLKEANAGLKDENTLLMERIDELEKESRSIQDDQELIEETIHEAIVQLEKAREGLPEASEGKPEPKKKVPVPAEEPEEPLEEAIEEATEENTAPEAPAFGYQPPAEADTVAEIYQVDDTEDEPDEEDDFFTEKGEPEAGSSDKGNELEIF